jgi:uncharacterized protein
MPHIFIDGYNYLYRLWPLASREGTSLDMLRRSLLDKLARYKRQRGDRITVVFDAHNSCSPARNQEVYRGIDVVYSKTRETADDVLIDWIMKRGAGMVVVSSDRAILDAAKSCGVPFLTPDKLDAMISSVENRNSNEPKDEGDEGDARGLSKKGNPRRLPKKLRRAVKTLRKL